MAAILARPGSAAVYAHLAWALGTGLGQYLLQVVDWILQDPGTLLGTCPLALALARRCASVLPEGEDRGLEPGLQSNPRLSLETALADTALTGLAACPAVRHREFADQVCDP